MKYELGGGIITEFVALRPKTYSYMTNKFIEMKKAKGTKKCVIKKMLKFEDYIKCLLDDKVILKSQQRFKSENHEVYTEDVNKIASSNDDDKRIVSLEVRLVAIHTDIRFKELHAKALGLVVNI